MIYNFTLSNTTIHSQRLSDAVGGLFGDWFFDSTDEKGQIVIKIDEAKRKEAVEMDRIAWWLLRLQLRAKYGIGSRMPIIFTDSNGEEILRDPAK